MIKMAKQPALIKKKILMILPKAMTGVTFQNPSFSPRRDYQFVHKYKHRVGKGSIMIPIEARRKAKHGGARRNQSTKSLEPSSPKVSCMGQIKRKKSQHRHQQHIKKDKARNMSAVPKVHHWRPLHRAASEVKQHAWTLRRIFRRARKSSRAAAVDGGSAVAVGAAPPLSQMKRFASGRGAFASFDWKAHVVAPENDGDDEDDETPISFSEPIMEGGGVALHPRTEINLWKRRARAPPKPLRLNPRPPPI